VSDRCVRCGKAAVVRRVLPPNDPMGVAGGPQPVCMACAELIDNSADGLMPAPSGGLPSTAGGNIKLGSTWVLVGAIVVLFVGALIAFILSNKP
jgi:hypothetical protein